MNEITDVKGQHYVWRYYLKPWSTDEIIWCKRGKSVFSPNISGIAKKRYFYEAEELNSHEMKFIEGFIKKMHPSAHLVNLSSLYMYENIASSDTHIKRNGIEKYHSDREGIAVEVFEELYNRNLDFLNDIERKIQFSQFLGLQYTRTKKNKDRITIGNHQLQKAFPEKAKNYDLGKMSHVITLIFSNVVGNWIYEHGNFSFVQNESSVPFLTCDQPVFNLCSKQGSKDLVEDFDLFYPLTPTLALRVSPDKLTDFVQVNSDSKIIENFNNLICANSWELIFSTTEDQLLEIC